MTTFLYTSGNQSIGASIGGGAVNRGLVLSRGLSHVITMTIHDRDRRPFNPDDPYYFKKVKPDPVLLPDYCLEVHLFDPRSQDSLPITRIPLHGEEWEHRTVDDIEEGRFEIRLDAELLNPVLPGFYEMAFRLTGIRTETGGSKTVVTDEFLGVNPDGSGRLPVRVDAGVLPQAREPVVITFHKQNYDKHRLGTDNAFRYVSNAIDAGAERNRRTTAHTIAVYHTKDFRGTLYAEGSLTDNPYEWDWFPVLFNEGSDTKTWTLEPEKEHEYCVEAFHFRASVRKFRFYWQPDAVFPARYQTTSLSDPAKKTIPGCISKILLRS